MDIRCQQLTGETCDVRFAGWTGTSRISSEVPDDLAELAVAWLREMRRQSEIGEMVASADEFSEDGTPVRMPSRDLVSMTQRIETPGGVITASSRAPGDLEKMREAASDPGAVDVGCLGDVLEEQGG